MKRTVLSLLVALAAIFALPLACMEGGIRLGADLIFVASAGGRWRLCIWDGHTEPRALMISQSSDVKAPARSPSSRKIAYLRDGGLWLVDTKSESVRQLAARFPNGSYGSPTWINNDLLAYTLYTVTPPTEDSDIFVYSFIDGKQRMLVRHTGSQDYPNISADGNWITYMSSVTTTVAGFGTTITQQLWIASLRTGRVEQLLTSGSRDTRPAWSPDGRTIAFSSDREGGPDIWAVEVGTRKLAKLTKGPGEKTDPRWSPDGKQLLYVSTASGRHGLELLDLETGQSKSLHPFGDKNIEIRDPAWGR
jgi:TolB protein